MNENKTTTVVSKLSLPLGFITWIVFMIMGYGFKVDWLYNNRFWIWFPLWIEPAAIIALSVLGTLIYAIFNRKD